jgi:hypothetical protein
MTDWSDEAQRYMDGEGPPPPDPRERALADAFLAAIGSYAADLRAPDASADRVVMAALRGRAGGRARRRTGWRWLIEPGLVLRPVVAAAAAVALVIASIVLTQLIQPATRPAAQPPGGPGRVGPGTVLVRFELDAPEAQTVALAGSFNGWSDRAVPCARSAETGRWTVTVALPPGEHQYLFVVDGGRWVPDPAAHAQVRDEFGQTNSVLVVGPRGVVRS